jgi:hypothetical protein
METPATCLVIDARKLESLSVDGPALKVTMRSQSARLFPFRRLSRVHVVGAIKEGIDTLLQCAERQIPVAFFTVAGKLRCQLYFPVYESSIISHWLEHVDFDVEAKQVYEDWLCHQTLNVISMTGFNEGARESRLQLLNEKLRRICKQRLGKDDFEAAMDWLSGILSAHLSQLIVEYGLANQSRGKRRLMEDLSPICETWLMFSLGSQVCKRRMRISAQSMSDLYQAQSEDIEFIIRRMLTQLATRLESII